MISFAFKSHFYFNIDSCIFLSLSITISFILFISLSFFDTVSLFIALHFHWLYTYLFSILLSNIAFHIFIVNCFFPYSSSFLYFSHRFSGVIFHFNSKPFDWFVCLPRIFWRLFICPIQNVFLLYHIFPAYIPLNIQICFYACLSFFLSF